MNNRIELLAPCGNMESLIAAVQGGANAVYLGLSTFSARAFAGNFNHEEFIEAITYCHIRGVKVYVTMNTLMFEEEIDNAMKEVDFLYNNDVDAILVQDYGLFDRIRHVYPDLELHASTQMHVHNVNGAKFLKESGATRVVLARETSLEVIQEACKTGVEIEVFSYGAICISYSGQCLFSQATKNRSGNRGMCAQCCRMKYTGLKDGIKTNEEEYMLSPKDLNAIELIPALIEAGVSSLKIEGRMKRKEYVYLVTKTFREAIDAYYSNKLYSIPKTRMEELKVMFNRGFSDGHINHASIEERMNPIKPNHIGIPLGTVLEYKKGMVCIKLSKELNQEDGIRVINDQEDVGFIANFIEKDGLLVNHADANDIVWVHAPNDAFFKIGANVVKTTDVVLMNSLQKEMEESNRSIGIKMNYVGRIGEPLRLQVVDEDGIKVSVTSDFIMQQAKKAPLTKENLEEKLSRINDYPYHLEKIGGKLEEGFLPVSKINETRRNALEALNDARRIQHVRLGKQEFKDCLSLKDSLPPKVIIDDHTDEINGDVMVVDAFEKNATKVIDEYEDTNLPLLNTIIRENGNLLRPMHHCIGGMSLNVTNSYALAFLYRMQGIDGVIFSSECNERMIQKSLEAFKERYGFVLPTYQFTQGRRALMRIKNGFTTYDIDTIQDIHNVSYPVISNGPIVMILEADDHYVEKTQCYGEYHINY